MWGIHPHTLYVHTPGSSCLMLAAFVPAQMQWEPACWQIIPLQPPLSNGKNASASSSSSMGGNLLAHITDSKPHCCFFGEIAHQFLHTWGYTFNTKTKTCRSLSVNLSPVAVWFSVICTWLPHLIAFLQSEQVIFNHHELFPLLSLKRESFSSSKIRKQLMSLSHTALNEEYFPPGAGVSLSSLFRSLARAKENALLTIAANCTFHLRWLS